MTLPEALNLTGGKSVIVVGPEGSFAEAWIQNGHTAWRWVKCGAVLSETYLIEEYPIPNWCHDFGWMPAWAPGK